MFLEPMQPEKTGGRRKGLPSPTAWWQRRSVQRLPLPTGSLTLASGDRQRIRPAWYAVFRYHASHEPHGPRGYGLPLLAPLPAQDQQVRVRLHGRPVRMRQDHHVAHGGRIAEAIHLPSPAVSDGLIFKFWLKVVMANREKTGRIVGTVAAVVLVISVLAIIYMATRPHTPSKDKSNLHLLPPPAVQTQGR